MKKSELSSLVDSLIPSLYGFAYALIPDELQAEQLVVDAYSVFMIREKQELSLIHLESENKERAAAKKFIQLELLSDIFDLGKKRSSQLKPILEKVKEHKEFYSLEIIERAVLYAKERLHLSNKELEEVFLMKNFQIIELLHNARTALIVTTDKEARA